MFSCFLLIPRPNMFLLPPHPAKIPPSRPHLVRVPVLWVFVFYSFLDLSLLGMYLLMKSLHIIFVPHSFLRNECRVHSSFPSPVLFFKLGRVPEGRSKIPQVVRGSGVRSSIAQKFIHKFVPLFPDPFMFFPLGALRSALEGFVAFVFSFSFSTSKYLPSLLF